jgi:LDH2 family malate/lactate/ureidoglycolate dehydrogenase
VCAKINGNQRIGMSIMKMAVDLGIKKAQTHGLAIVGMNNYSSSTGGVLII